MANIKDFIKKIGNETVSLEEQQKALAAVEQTIVEAKAKREESIGKNVDLVISALKKIESDLNTKLVELNNTPAKQGVAGPKGEKGRDGRDGIDGYKGKDGKDGVDGKDGKDGEDGISVSDAQIDFDGSLLITLSDGREIDAGTVIPLDVAKQIHSVSTNGGGTSQSVLDAITDLQTQINTLTGIDGVLGDMAQQNANAVAITGGTINGTTVGGTTPSTGSFTDVTDSSLTSGRVTYAGTGGNLRDASNFTYDGTNLVAGAIQNTPIGATTPAAGKFTTLESTGTGSFGTTSAQYIQAVGNALYPQILAVGSGTNIPLVLQPKGTGALQAQLTDSTATGGNARGANAVDWQTSRSAATQVASGYYNIIGGGYANTGTANAAVTTQSATMNGTTAVTLSGSNASIKVGQYITGTSISAQTYVSAISGTSLTLSQAASGSSTSTLSFFTPHGVVVGGGNNQATGSYSFIGGGGDAGTAANRNVASGDWSIVGGGVKNTASGGAAFVGGGGWNGAGVFSGNTASATSSVVVGGNGNQAQSSYAFVAAGFQNVASGRSASVLSGEYGTTRNIIGNTVFAASQTPVSATLGVQQAALLVLGAQTTDATATALTSSAAAASGTNQVILPNNSAYYFTGEVVSGVTGGGNSKGWEISGLIKRGANAAATTLVGSTVTSLYADAGAATWALAVTADTTNGGIRVTFTGQAGTTIRTVCQIRTTEMTY